MGVLCGRHYQSHCHHLHTIQTEQNCVMTRMRTRSQISSPLIRCMAASGCSVSPSTGGPAVVRQEPSSGDTSTQPRSIEKEFDFIERPSQDFFCPVSLELLLEPQLTSCCGHHLSLEAATRLQREGKPCPMCNGEEWSAVLDKYHRRKVHEVRVRCWHKENGCEWVGEVNELKRHADSCVKRPWECQYCALKCTYEEGEGKHWPTCTKFPEPCPNGCEVGSVERCNMEQHRSVCSLEPVACEMKEFGCSVVVPRKELATHMRESELQHLTGMTMLNLCLCRQLQQDSTERDRKMAQLQQEIAEQKKLQTEMKKKMDEFQAEQKKLQTEMKKKTDEFQAEQKKELSELKDHIQKVECATHHLEQHTDCGPCSSGTVSQIITFTQFSKMERGDKKTSEPFYTHHHGYKFALDVKQCLIRTDTRDSAYIGIVIYLCPMRGEYDSQLCWPVEVKVHIQLLNQAGDHHHIEHTEHMSIAYHRVHHLLDVNNDKMKACSDGIKYVINDCLKFRIHITVL